MLDLQFQFREKYRKPQATNGCAHFIIYMSAAEPSERRRAGRHLRFELPLVNHRQLFHPGDLDNRDTEVVDDLSVDLVKTPSAKWKAIRDVGKMNCIKYFTAGIDEGAEVHKQATSRACVFGGDDIANHSHRLTLLIHQFSGMGVAHIC